MQKNCFERGANVDAPLDNQLRPPFAVQMESLGCLRLMREAGADPSLTKTDGSSAMDIASERNKYECMEKLTQPGVPIRGAKSTVTELLSKKAIEESDGATPKEKPGKTQSTSEDFPTLGGEKDPPGFL